MKRPIIVLIRSSPLKSHKPVEAIRIALGLIGGEHPVQIVLLNEAPLVLGEDPEDLQDGDLLPKYLPAFRELGQSFYVEEASWKKLDIEADDFEVIPLPMKQISALLDQASGLVAF